MKVDELMNWDLEMKFRREGPTVPEKPAYLYTVYTQINLG